LSLLIDTHVLLWWWEDSPRLGVTARNLIASSPEVWISAASAWEIAIKAGLGRLQLDEPLETCLPRIVAESGFRPLAVRFEHALGVGGLPRYHLDPFDRLLIAQALVENLRIVTADSVFTRYQVPLVAADR
jgi:PIN domain nuclease of toxin-antitoxin system